MRNTYDFDCGEETGFWHVIKDAYGGMQELSSKTRNRIRRALKTYEVKRVAADEMLRCLDVYNKANRGYRIRADEVSEEAFAQRICSKPAIGEAEYWQAVDRTTGKVAAFAINTVHPDCCEYNTMKADPEALHNSTYPYYGLIFTMNQYYLEERGLKYVDDGGRSITEHSNVQPFLIEKFGFRKAYCRLKIHYNRWMGVAVAILYPFRKLIKHRKVAAILYQEAMARGEA